MSSNQEPSGRTVSEHGRGKSSNWELSERVRVEQHNRDQRADHEGVREVGVSVPSDGESPMSKKDTTRRNDTPFRALLTQDVQSECR